MLIVKQNIDDNKNQDKKDLSKITKINKFAKINEIITPSPTYPTYAGTDAICNNRGNLNIFNTCTCEGDWKGNFCQYSKIYQCNNRGEPDLNNNGKCLCYKDPLTNIPNFRGDQCQYSNFYSCSNRGVVNDFGLCNCGGGYTGLSCQITPVPQQYNASLTPSPSSCPPGSEGRPDCQRWANANFCNGAGVYSYMRTNVTTTPNENLWLWGCDCLYDNFTGKKLKGISCQFSDRVQCNNFGQVDDRGNCNCYNPKIRGGPKCLNCPDGKAGGVDKGCPYSDQDTCENRGKVQDDGTCLCEPGKFAGNRCKFSRVTDCKNRGNVSVQVVNGTEMPLCTCEKGEWGNALGSSCEFTDLYTCNNNGTIITRNPPSLSNPTPIPECKCLPLFTGPNCKECKGQFIGNYCNYFKDNSRFKNQDSSIILNFSSPGLIVIAKLKPMSPTQPPIEKLIDDRYNIYYVGYYINKDATMTTEFFYEGENNVPTSDKRNVKINISLVADPNDPSYNETIKGITDLENIDEIYLQFATNCSSENLPSSSPTPSDCDTYIKLMKYF